MTGTLIREDRDYVRFVSGVVSAVLGSVALLFAVAATSLTASHVYWGVGCSLLGGILLMLHRPWRSLGAGLTVGTGVALLFLAAFWAVFALDLAGA